MNDNNPGMYVTHGYTYTHVYLLQTNKQGSFLW